MKIEHLVYDDSVIAVALVAGIEKSKLMSLALRWLDPGQAPFKDGTVGKLTNLMGGETDWFIVPISFGAAIGRTLVMQKVAGLPGFKDDGFDAMVAWLVANEELLDAMCY